MIMPDMCYPVMTVGNSCDGCIAHRNNTWPSLCESLPNCEDKIYKLKREYKPHYRTPPANYRDSENDLS